MTWSGPVGPDAGGGELLRDALCRFERVAVDVGCGDGKYTLRLARRDPTRLVIGIDAETTRLDRTFAAARKQRMPNLLFVAWSMEEPLPTLAERADEIHIVMPWGSLLDGVLGGDEAILSHVLALGRPGARYESVVNCRPWDAPASVDAKLASTPVPSQQTLEKLHEVYGAHGWQLGEPAWLDDREARAIGSSWVSRVVSHRQAMLLRLTALRDV